jgi:diguanylate cyclase (GGDEF)-like protein/PAS domain S-box-containing protein
MESEAPGKNLSEASRRTAGRGEAVTIEKRLFAVIPLVAIAVWLIDAAMDAYLFERGGFLDVAFFDVPPQKIFVRWFFILFYSVFAAVLIRILSKQREARGELQRHLAAIEASMDGIALFNERHEYLYLNDAYARITGYPGPRELIGKTFAEVYDEQQLRWIEEVIFPALEQKGSWRGEMSARRRDRTLFDQEASITRLPDGSCVCVMRDISERKGREEALTRSEKFLSTIFDSIRDPFCIFDREFRIVRANEAYAELKGKAMDSLLEETCYRALEGRESVCEDCVIQRTLQSGDPCAKEKSVTLKSGDTVWLEIYTYPIFDASGAVTYVIEYTRDVTDRKKADEDRRRLIERLEYLSQIDGLTGLLNRRALTDQLGYELDRARRYEAELAVILCDLDNLKEINDTHGHLAGDMTLQLLAATLRGSLRIVDIAGRYGGDEFLVIVPQTSTEGALSIAEKIRRAAERTEVRLEGGKSVAISLSIGVAGLAPPPEGMDSLISRVDAALYASKNAGKNKVTLAP